MKFFWFEERYSSYRGGEASFNTRRAIQHFAKIVVGLYRDVAAQYDDFVPLPYPEDAPYRSRESRVGVEIRYLAESHTFVTE